MYGTWAWATAIAIITADRAMTTIMRNMMIAFFTGCLLFLGAAASGRLPAAATM